MVKELQRFDCELRLLSQFIGDGVRTDQHEVWEDHFEPALLYFARVKNLVVMGPFQGIDRAGSVSEVGPFERQVAVW